MTVNINNIIGEIVRPANLALMLGSGAVATYVAYKHPEFLPFDPMGIKNVSAIPNAEPSKVDIETMINENSFVSTDSSFNKASTLSMMDISEGKWIGKNFNLAYDISPENEGLGGKVAIMSENGINFFRTYTEKYKMNMGVIGQIVPIPKKDAEVEDFGMNFQYRVNSSWEKAGAYVVVSIIPLSVWARKDKIDPFIFSIHTVKIPVKVFGKWQKFILYDNKAIVNKLNMFLKATEGEPFVVSIGAIKSNMDTADTVDIKDATIVVRFKEKEVEKQQKKRKFFPTLPMYSNMHGNGTFSPWDVF